MIELLWPYLKYLFGFIGVVVVAEMYVSARWWPTYFLAGIPIYRRTFRTNGESGRLPTAAEIEAALPDSGWSSPMLIRQIGDNSFAFREAMRHFDIGYPPVMHGSIVLDRTTGNLKIYGYVNTYIALFSCFFLLAPLAIPLDPIDYIFPVFVWGLVAWIYRIQARRYRQVEEAVIKAWPQL